MITPTYFQLSFKQETTGLVQELPKFKCIQNESYKFTFISKYQHIQILNNQTKYHKTAAKLESYETTAKLESYETLAKLESYETAAKLESYELEELKKL